LNLLPEAQQKNKMSIQSIQVFKKQALVSRKGKKFTIVDFEDVKQFWFQEDIWEHIKSYFIPRSRWFYSMRNTGISSLRNLLRGLYFALPNVASQKLIAGIDKLTKNRNISDFEKIKRLKKRIIQNIQFRPDYQNLLKDGARFHSKESLTDFRVNEEVLFWTDYDINGILAVKGYRKGIIRKINKKSLRIDLFKYETKTEGSLEEGDEVRWLNTISTSILVYEDDLINIRRKGFIYVGVFGGTNMAPRTFEDEFKVGEIDMIYTL